MKRHRLKRILALDLCNRTLQVVEIRRGSGAQHEIRHSLQATLSLDPWASDPQLSGREIQNLLLTARIKPAPCIVCLPIQRVLVHHMQLPELTEADALEFINLESERAFPFSPQDLISATSRAVDPAGVSQATVVGLLTSQAATLQQVLRSAGLQLLSITLGSVALLDPAAPMAEAHIALTLNGIEMIVATSGGLLGLRTLSEPLETADRDTPLDIPAITRECRITLARLPAQIRSQLKVIHLHGYPTLDANLKTALGLELESMGFKLESAGIDTTGQRTSTDVSAHPPGATLAALNWLAGHATPVEFLVPRINRVKQFLRRFMARGVLWRVGGAVGCIVLLICLAMAWQFWRLAGLERRWAAIETRVKTLESLQRKMHDYRPWFDDSIPSLTILRELTEAFPNKGEVWTRTLEIKDLSQVVCSGYANTEADWTSMRNKLGKMKNVQNLKIEQVRGTKPMQFNLTFQWKQGGNRGQTKP
jgi:hypothetical protein